MASVERPLAARITPSFRLLCLGQLCNFQIRSRLYYALRQCQTAVNVAMQRDVYEQEINFSAPLQ